MSQLPIHSHSFEETPTLDGAGIERVCRGCGEVAQSEITEFDKLSGCLDADGYNNLRFGAPTPVALHSFLLPTLRRIKCRDRYVDIKILGKLKVYTDLLGICQRANIPKSYADETMRILLKRKRGLYSKYEPSKVLATLLITPSEKEIEKVNKKIYELTILRDALLERKKTVSVLGNRVDILIPTKRCGKCKKQKPLNAFTKEKSKRLGVSSYCKECMQTHMRRVRKRRKKLLRR